jgi:hypothetical protein
MAHARNSRAKLNTTQLHLFEGDTLFDKVARAVCGAECLPRKELYESWEVARRVRRRMRGGRVVDLACGHGLVAWLLLLLDDTSERALAVDKRIPESAAKIEAVMTRAWPRLAGRVERRATAIGAVGLDASDVVVSAHACGTLTDEVIDAAIRARARVAVLPCCHDEKTCDAGGLAGWMDSALAIDATRAAKLGKAGYRVFTQEIPDAVTPKNRLLLGEPRSP